MGSFLQLCIRVLFNAKLSLIQMALEMVLRCFRCRMKDVNSIALSSDHTYT